MDEAPNLDESGYAAVDAQPHAAGMVAGMEATAQWPAVRELRAWSRRRLALRPGERLLDVGCGIADEAIALAADVVPGGEVVAIDASEAMLDAARLRAKAAAPSGATIRLLAGDALAIDAPDGSFDAVRSERVLQWLPDEAAAVAEMVRVLAPGGRLSLIDTDWHTFTVDLPAGSGGDEFTAAMLTMRGDATRAGRRLLNHARRAGLLDIECTGAAHVWDRWDPDREPGPSGLFPLAMITDGLVAGGLLDADTARRFVTATDQAARDDRFFASITMFAVSGRR